LTCFALLGRNFTGAKNSQHQLWYLAQHTHVKSIFSSVDGAGADGAVFRDTGVRRLPLRRRHTRTPNKHVFSVVNNMSVTYAMMSKCSLLRSV